MLTLCVICKELISSQSSQLAAIPCGHLYHFTCIRQWIVDSNKKSCPTCRKTAPASAIVHPLYFDTSGSDETPSQCSENVGEHNEALREKVTLLESDLSESQQKVDQLNKSVETLFAERISVQQSLDKLKRKVTSMKMESDVLRREAACVADLHSMVNSLKDKINDADSEIESLKYFKYMMDQNTTANDCTNVLDGLKYSEQSMQQVVSMLKTSTKGFKAAQKEKEKLADQASKMKNQLRDFEKRSDSLKKQRDDLFEELKLRSNKKTPLLPRVKQMMQNSPITPIPGFDPDMSIDELCLDSSDPLSILPSTSSSRPSSSSSSQRMIINTTNPFGTSTAVQRSISHQDIAVTSLEVTDSQDRSLLEVNLPGGIPRNVLRANHKLNSMGERYNVCDGFGGRMRLLKDTHLSGMHKPPVPLKRLVPLPPAKRQVTLKRTKTESAIVSLKKSAQLIDLT